MELGKETIEKIESLATKPNERIIMCGGRQFILLGTNQVKEVLHPTDNGLETHTLESVVEYTKSTDCPDVLTISIVVETPDSVLVCSNRNFEQNRSCHLQATRYKVDFPFGRFLDIEEFIIQVQTCFTESEEKQRLIKWISGVKGKSVQINQDDGISQTVTREDGIGRLQNDVTSPIVSLSPFRTFAEVEQPESKFLLRIRKGDENPTVALMVADGDQWKADAINSIKEYLRANTKDISIIG